MDKLKIYLAGGWFDVFQVEALDFLEETLFSREDFKVFSPRKEIKLNGTESTNVQEIVFTENCRNIEDADIVVASTVGKDMGTLWETGFAYAKNKPIIYTFFDKRFKDAKFNLMLSASGVACFTDKAIFMSFIDKLNKKNYNTVKRIYEGGFE